MIRMGSGTAFAAGFFMLASAASYLCWPGEFFIGAGVDFFRMMLSKSGLYYFTYLAFMLSALCGIGVVLTVSELVQSADRGLVRWIGTLGIVGFSVIALNFLFQPFAAVRQSKTVLGQQGSFDGYGLYLSTNLKGQILVAPFADSPAERAGVQTGDVLVAVNGDSMRCGTKVQIVFDILKASAGNVSVTVRKGDQPARDLMMQKSKVEFWDVSAQNSIAASSLTNIDPGYLLGFGLAGLWFLVIHWIALKHGVFSKIQGWLGIAVGIGFWLFVSQFYFDLPVLTTIGKFLGLILGPVWFIWTGFAFRKKLR